MDRRQAYAADITYGTNHEFGFDYLRDNLALRREERVQRARNFAIVDEVDNILIDEARTPLIISGPAAEEQTEYKRMAQMVRQLRPEDYEINERDRTVVLTEAGEGHVEELLGQPLSDPDRPEDVTPEQARLTGHLTQAMRAELLFRRNRDYLVQGGQVVIVDEFTGRLMHGRRWSDGLHQAVEAKEGLEVQPENVTYATITLQNYFRLYGKLAGMTGTALTEAEEFDKIYKLDVVPIPTNLEYIASRAESDLAEVPYKEEDNKFFFFARKEDPKTPVFWRRKDYKDVIFRTEEAKYRAVCTEILQMHSLGRPVLMGTTSVDRSEVLSERMRAEPLRKLALTIILRDAWCRAHNIQEDGRLIEELQPLGQPLGTLTPAVLRAVAKPLSASLNPEDTANVDRLLDGAGAPGGSPAAAAAGAAEGNPAPGAQRQEARRGKPDHHRRRRLRRRDDRHQHGRPRGRHQAGRRTGRGDSGRDQPRAAPLGRGRPVRPDQRRAAEALESADAEQIGVYATEVEFFRKHMREEQKVRELGGLHVLGSERHEARRIDNQLRGRAGRQGDPGSSRFFLSMEDDLMRRFGGEQVSNMMQTMRIDDAVPLESGLVGRMIEQAQSRVEGANFDVRKHLIEYDDVLNKQRAKVYEMRERIYEKDDLIDDIRDDALRGHPPPHYAFPERRRTLEAFGMAGGCAAHAAVLRRIGAAVVCQPGDHRRADGGDRRPRGCPRSSTWPPGRWRRKPSICARRSTSRWKASRSTPASGNAKTATRWRRRWKGAEIEAKEKGEPLAPRALVDAAAAAAAIDTKAVPRELLAPERTRDLRQHLLALTGEAAWVRASTQAAAWLQRRTGLLPERAACARRRVRRGGGAAAQSTGEGAGRPAHAGFAGSERSDQGRRAVGRRRKRTGGIARGGDDAHADLLRPAHPPAPGRGGGAILMDPPRREIGGGRFLARRRRRWPSASRPTCSESLDMVSAEWGRRYWHQIAEQTLDSLAGGFADGDPGDDARGRDQTRARHRSDARVAGASAAAGDRSDRPPGDPPGAPRADAGRDRAILGGIPDADGSAAHVDRARGVRPARSAGAVQEQRLRFVPGADAGRALGRGLAAVPHVAAHRPAERACGGGGQTGRARTARAGGKFRRARRIFQAQTAQALRGIALTSWGDR